MDTPTLRQPANIVAPISRVRIENFRGVRDLIVDLDEHVTVLFGVNAAGKTTILDAIAIGLGAIVSRVPRAKSLSFDKQGDIRIPWKSNKDWNEKVGAERPYARITLTGEGEISWDVQKLRWKGDRPVTPSVGTRHLHDVLDPLIKEALEGGEMGAERQSALPLVAAYSTERAVVTLPLRRRDFSKEFHRFAALDEALKTSTRFKAVFEWFVVAEDEVSIGLSRIYKPSLLFEQ